MKNKLSIIVYILSIVYSYAQIDLTPDQLEPVEIEKIISTETTSYFGNSISFSTDGTVLAVGEYGYGTSSTVSSGRVRVYSSETGSWAQKGQDILGINDSFNTFGKKVELSLDGNTLAVYDSQIGITLNAGQTLEDVYGSLAVEYFPYIQVYQYISGAWTQIGDDFLFNEIDDYSDMSLSGDGMSLAIATKSGTNVYEFVSNSWVTIGQEIVSGDPLFDDKISLSENGETLIIGDPFFSDPNTTDQFSYEGRVKVYQNISNTWTQIGSTINGTDYLGYLGSKVSISADGNTIAIGTDQTNDIDYIAILEFVGGNWVSKGTNIQQIGSTSIISMELSNDGNAIVIGESFPYSARVLKYDTDWEQVNVAIESDVATDQLGYAVTISGDGNRYAAGAPSTDLGGANGYVSIYEHNKNSVARFGNEIYGYGSYDDLGSGVAVSGDGNTIAVGANGAFGSSGTFGHVRVFEKTTNGLQQIGSDIRNTTDFTTGAFGTEMALNADGSLLAVSAPLLFGSAWGAVYVYERNGNTWDPLGNIIYGTYGSRTGSSLAFSDDGSILAVGSGGNPGGGSEDQYTGYTTVYYYNNTNNTWEVLGQQISGEAEWDFSGAAIDLSGDGTIVAIGARGNDGATVSGGHGHARVFEYNGSDWVQRGDDIDGDPDFNVNFGGVVTLSNDGNTLIVSDLNSQSDAGSVKVYNWDETTSTWEFHQLLKTFFGTGPNNSHRFEFGSGTAISDDGNVLVIGEYKDAGKGKVHVYVKDDTGTWIESGLFLNGTHNGNQYFGINLDLSSNGNTLLVGGWGHNENGTRTGMAAVYHLNLCSTIDGFETFSGAVDTPVTPSDNLIVNGSAEILPVTDNGWTSVTGNWEWTISNNQGVPVEFGHKYFRTSATGNGELYQDVDVSSLSAAIDANNQYFYFSTYLQSFDSNVGIDDSQAIVEYRDISGNVLSTYDTGLSQNTQEWTLFENIRLAPAQTRTIRVRLIVTNNSQFGQPNAFIDNVFLSTTEEPATISIPDPNFEQVLIDENIDTDGIINAQMQASDALGVTSLVMNNKNISDLTGIEFFTNLEMLSALDNNLSDIDLSANVALESLILSLNNLTQIDLSNNLNLTSLTLASNQLTSLDVTNNIELTELLIGANNLSALDVSTLSLLTRLEVTLNQLVELDLSQNLVLETVFCDDNDLVNLNLQNGNNLAIDNASFNASANPNLFCIQVDDINYSDSAWTNLDAQSFFGLDCAPNNDDCIEATSLDLGTLINGTTFGSTSSNSSPSCQVDDIVLFDVWYQFTAPTSGLVTAVATSVLNSLPINMAIYEDCNAVEPISCDSGTIAVTDLIAGNTYFIQIWVGGNIQGRSVLNELDEFTLIIQDTATLSTTDLEPLVSTVKLMPNPASNQTLITSSSKDINSLQVFDITGKKVLELSQINKRNQRVDISDLSKGMYLVLVKLDNVTTLTKKLLIK